MNRIVARIAVRVAMLAMGVAVGIWAWGYFFPSPQKVIERNLARLAQYASFPPNQGNFKKLADVERIRSLLAENIHVTLDASEGGGHSFDNREELLQAALAARSAGQGLQVGLGDVHVMLHPDKVTAEAMLTMTAKIAGASDPLVEELKFSFGKVERDWVVTRIEWVRPYK